MPTEKEIHQGFNRFLRERGIPFIEARMDRASTIAKSWPDYTILWMGRVICIEVKTEKGRVSPAQNLKIDFIRQSGCRVEICRSLQECVEAAKGILCQSGDKNDVAGRAGHQEGLPKGTHDFYMKPKPPPRNPAEGQKESPSEPADVVFIADWDRIPCVYVETGKDTAAFLRTATPYDLLNIPRR